MARKRKREPEIPIKEQEGPDWRAFGRMLAIGRLRRLGLAPIPPEVLEQMKEAGLCDEMGRVTATSKGKANNKK